MRNNDTILKTLIVAVSLCLVCSAIISSAAVGLRDLQQANKALDQQSKVLASAGLLIENRSIEDLFSSIQEKIINLDTGLFVDSFEISTFDASLIARNKETSISLDSKVDIAILKRRENFQKVFLHYNDKRLSSIILPVRGYGLWGTLYGYLAVEPDFQTIIGLEFYQHKETPGLGAEVDNPRWKKIWKGKKIYSAENQVLISVIKGQVDNTLSESVYQVDGLSGATITSNGVSNLLTFWLGELGYGNFIKKFKFSLNELEEVDV